MVDGAARDHGTSRKRVFATGSNRCIPASGRGTGSSRQVRTYIAQTDSRRKDASHTLYAQGSDSETLRFNFSFPMFQEVTNVKVSAAKCEIESVNLY